MAQSMGIMGHPNTGKSHSRSFIKDGSDCFVLSPSQKFSHLFTGEGDKRIALPPFDFRVQGVSWSDTAKNSGISKNELIRSLSLSDLPPGYESRGNSAIVLELEYLIVWLKFIDKHMPHIKTVFLADFTHWMSSIIASPKFKSRKSGGEAFAR